MHTGIKMIRKLSKEESGYSLVEVIVSIFILAIAIIPMVGMFDMGLRSATTGGNYDGARALANANLEKVRSLPYPQARATYQPVNATNPEDPNRHVSCDQGIFTCKVATTYVNDAFAENPAGTTDTLKMRVVVTVTWQGGQNYTITGLTTR